MMNEAMQNSLIESPLKHTSCPDFPIIQYADDTVLVLPAGANQLLHIKNLLLRFANYTGLEVNYSKSAPCADTKSFSSFCSMTKLIPETY